MLKVRNNNGVVLFIVLGVVLITATLAAVILSLVVSHYRLTHHQSSRIQAYYASMAGVNYALEMLRTGNWTANSCPSPGGCNLTSDDSFPNTIQQPIRIILTPPNPPACSAPSGGACINVTSTYTYTPSP